MAINGCFHLHVTLLEHILQDIKLDFLVVCDQASELFLWRCWDDHIAEGHVSLHF